MLDALGFVGFGKACLLGWWWRRGKPELFAFVELAGDGAPGSPELVTEFLGGGEVLDVFFLDVRGHLLVQGVDFDLGAVPAVVEEEG